MSFNSLLLACLFLLGASISAEHVSELGDSDFESELENMDTALVMFYAPWCGHCKKLKPEFEKSAGDLLSHDPPVNLVKVDCTEAGKETCSRFQVSGYPTLKIFRNGEVSSDYNGPRDASGITKFMQAQVGPASKELKNDEEVEQYLAKKKETLIVCHCGEGAKAKETFEKVANKMRETTAFGLKSGKMAGFEGVVLHRPPHLVSKMEDASLKYEGKMATSDLSDWIKKNYHGLVGHRTPDNVKEFVPPMVMAFYEVDYIKNVKGTNYWRNRVMKVAKSHTKTNFAVVNKDDFLSELSEYGLDTPSTPDQKKPIVCAKDAKAKKYVMEKEFSIENLEQFVSDFEAGKLVPFMKSEEVPDNSANDVKVIVAKNYEELIGEEKEKDVLIEFYAPWCGHCKKLAPIFDDVGAAMKGENVIIAKMDATANDVPGGFEVRGFPTLFWIPAGGKPTSYEGGRDKDDFIKYIAKNAKNELNGFDRKGKAKKVEL